MATIQQLYERIEQLASAASRDEATSNHVRHLIEDARRYLTGAGGQIGPWEDELLAQAEGARASGWLRLAIMCVGKALQVNSLPAGEYDYGFNYTRL